MGNVTGMRLVAHDDGSYEIVAKRAADRVVIAPVGSPERQVYKRKYNERHSAVYIPTKKVDVYERIQSYANQCDKVALMARAKSDPSVLQQRSGFYGDFSAAGDLRDMYQSYSLMKGDFENLGEEVKAKFGGSFESFLSGIASGAFTGSNSSEGVKEKEVETDEQK